jgi:hypothetical protein
VPVVLWNLYASETVVGLLVGLVPAPIGIIIVACVFRLRPGSVYNRILALGALQLILFAVAATLHALLP